MLAESPLDFLSVGQSAAACLTKGDGNPMFNAMRVFRIEINRAHGIANQRSAAATPGCVGTRFLLSCAHPRPDICDLLATQNLYGLGPGVHPHGTRPWPARPNTLSYEVAVLEDTVTEEDRGGKETPVEALKRLTPVQRIGALGLGKAQMLEAGSLTQGMIKTPLAKARARLDVQELSPEAQRLRTETRQAAARNAFQPTRARQRIAQVVNDIIPSAEARAAAGRAAWGDFPRVNILAALGDLRKHPRYAEAKVGDYTAAYDIVRDIEARAERPWTQVLREQLGEARPVLVPVHAREAPDARLGNALPSALAMVLGAALDLPVDRHVVQMAAMKRTGADGWSRLALPPGYAGQLAAPARGALIIDDTLTQGGTLASLRGWLASQGAHVHGAVTLTGKQYSATLSIQPDTLTALRGRYAAIENWWIATFGYGFDRLTESEGRYLVKSGATADQVRSRIAASRQAAGL